MTSIPCRVLLALCSAGAPGTLPAQEGFTVEARGPFRAGEWVALALDPESAKGALEIAVHPEGRAEPFASFRASPEKSAPPARFPLRLDEVGRYEVRFDGRVVQRLAFEMRGAATWPARTWVPGRGEVEPRAWWELAAFDAVYAPLASGEHVQRAARWVGLGRRLPDAPLEVDALRGRRFLQGLQLGHLLAGALAALLALSLGLSKRVRAPLWIGAGLAAALAQLAWPALFWGSGERVLVWTAWREPGGAWHACADELRFGDGEVALEDDVWLEPIAGGEILGCRARAGGWIASFRGGLVRRWLGAGDGERGGGDLDPRQAFVAELGEAFEASRWVGTAELAPTGADASPEVRREGTRAGGTAARRSRAALLEALARAYAAAGERSHALWRSTRAGAPPRFLGNALPWVRFWWRAALAATSTDDAASASIPLRGVHAEWYPLREAPATPFGGGAVPRFLRLRDAVVTAAAPRD